MRHLTERLEKMALDLTTLTANTNALTASVQGLVNLTTELVQAKAANEANAAAAATAAADEASAVAALGSLSDHLAAITASINTFLAANQPAEPTITPASPPVAA